jgi:hypothetical protein
MDWKQFVASLVGSLAWPIVLLIIVTMYREELIKFLKQIKKIGAGGVNVELSEQVAAVRDAGKAVEAEQGVQPPEALALNPAIVQLAKSFPEAALVQAFKELEGVLQEIRSRLPDDKPHRNLTEVVKALAEQKYITQNVVALFQKLQETRNIAAHTKNREEMSPAEAIELITQIKLLQTLLTNVCTQLPPRSDRV